ncbi:MAG: preprotein translocase subunit SecE [Candidatus Pacebacteria bacterium]|nr:preprotein translocase subunit SecE [Candidatus Paceibacterota bacterium]
MAKAIAAVDEQVTGIDRLKSRPRELKEFLQDVRSEMRKVVTPTRPEVRATTTVVIGTVFLFAAYFTVTDYVFGQGVTHLIQFLTKH